MKPPEYKPRGFAESLNDCIIPFSSIIYVERKMLASPMDREITGSVVAIDVLNVEHTLTMVTGTDHDSIHERLSEFSLNLAADMAMWELMRT